MARTALATFLLAVVSAFRPLSMPRAMVLMISTFTSSRLATVYMLRGTAP